MSPQSLHGTLVLWSQSDTECGLELRLENRGSTPLDLDYLEPLLPSEIEVWGPDGQIPVIQPAANLISRPVSRTVAPGETVDLPLAPRLRFDAAAPPAGGGGSAVLDAAPSGRTGPDPIAGALVCGRVFVRNIPMGGPLMWTLARLLVIWLMLGGGSACHKQQAVSEGAPGLGVTCTVEVLPAGGDARSLRFILKNASRQAVPLRYFAPFTGFEARATIAGQVVPLRQGADNRPVQPVDVLIPAGGSHVLTTPIVLRFVAADAPPPAGTEWHLVHPPAPVKLAGKLSFEALGPTSGTLACESAPAS